jgi:hypothetical protein
MIVMSVIVTERDFERSRQQAFDALRFRQAWHAFSLQDEPLALIERYGDNRFGRSCFIVHVSDFVATIYHALGCGAATRVTDPLGRPHYIVQGKPVRELF